ncbi:LysR family transcriptional regulator [Nioella nitratireducens]|uniref:LysR family transcriptional regulator n=1 Tax=Nioella nitratireducens TaxID=1287720 RepID=UPI0008FD24B1|nr:LysR family transcriptional regulator [Nioella nitratireducens]
MESKALNIDFADLRTLRLVHEHLSFSEVAQILGVNQSAVSYTIEKLRRAFDDQLFFRQGGGVVATERCAVIATAAAGMLADLEQLAMPEAFDPAEAEHRFTIACNFYERQLILPLIMRKLRETAPNMRVDTINSISLGHLQLKRGEAELLIGPLKPEEAGFYCRNLATERYVCVMDPDNPLARKPLTLEDYLTAKHAVVLYGGGWRSGYLRALDRMGRSLDQVLSVPSPAGLNRVLAGTDLLSTVPNRIADTFGDGLHITDCPCPAPFDIDLVWTERTHRSPIHIWLRELISREVKAALG